MASPLIAEHMDTSTLSSSTHPLAAFGQGTRKTAIFNISPATWFADDPDWASRMAPQLQTDLAQELDALAKARQKSGSKKRHRPTGTDYNL